jgi:hypothetical protein
MPAPAGFARGGCPLFTLPAGFNGTPPTFQRVVIRRLKILSIIFKALVRAGKDAIAGIRVDL